MKFDTEGNAIIGNIVVSNGTYVIPNTEYTSTGNWILSVVSEEVVKIILETTSLIDAPLKETYKIFTDSTILSDTILDSISKILSELVYIYDIRISSTLFGLFDVTYLQETRTLKTIKITKELVNFSDAFVTLKSKLQTLFETISTTDLRAFSTTKE